MRPAHASVLVLAAAVAGGACFVARDPGEVSLRAEVQRYLDRYGPEYQRLTLAAREAQWAAETRIVPNDTSAVARLVAAEGALAEFLGSTENVELSRAYLRRKRELAPVQVRELEAILRAAGNSPQTAPTLVKQRIAAEARQAAALDGYAYQLDGAPTTAAGLDAVLRTETDPARRLRAWEASKALGPGLREGLVTLRSVRNEVVRALGHPDQFAFALDVYGSPDRLAQQLFEIQRELRPLYQELHTWVRHELARRYGEPVPDLIPAHWLPDRFGRDWSALAPVEGYDLDAALREKSPQWLVEQGDRFYQGLGFEPLPPTFWERSSLFPVPGDAGYAKTDRASAWHVDLDRDVRCLLNVAPTGDWYQTVVQDMGDVHYALAYSTPQVPMILREGPSRAFQGAIGSMLGFAAVQPRCARASGLEPGAARPDPMRLLLRDALRHAVFIPWAAGVVFEWERDVYGRGLPADRWNRRWWEYVAHYQGIAPPAPRDERWCDPATVPEIEVDPATHYDRALACILLFQLHDHIARNVLREDVHDTSYAGRRDVGDFLRTLMRPGATLDWIQLLRDRTGSAPSVRSMVDYFEPLRGWLVEENRGRASTLPPL